MTSTPIPIPWDMDDEGDRWPSVVKTFGNQRIHGKKLFLEAPIFPDGSLPITAVSGLAAALAGGSGGGTILQPGTALLVVDNGTTWSRTPAAIASARALGYTILWSGTRTPAAGDGWVSGDVTLGSTGGSGGGTTTPPVSQDLTVTYSGSSWDKTSAQVATARAAGGKITWAGTTVLPTPTNGLAEGDTVTGTFAAPTPTEPVFKVSIPTGAVPTANDQTGVTNDTVRIYQIPGLTWTVAGTDYPDTAFSTYTKDVPTGGLASVPVSLKSSDPARFGILDPVTSWTLTFDTTVASTTPVTIPAGSVPVAHDNGSTSVYGSYVTLTSVPNTIWVVDGVSYPSAGFTGTRNVTYLKGTPTTVTVQPSGPEYTISGTSSWPLTFTNTATWAPLPVFRSGSFDTFKGQTLAAPTVTGGMDGLFGGTVGDLTLKSGGTYSVNSSGFLVITSFNSKVSFGKPTGTVCGLELRVLGTGAGGNNDNFSVYICGNDNKNLSLGLNGGTLTVFPASTTAAYTGAISNGATITAGYDHVNKKAAVAVNGTVVWSGACDIGTQGILYQPSISVTGGNYVEAVDNVIVYG